MAQYRRVLLKLSGEALAGEKGTGFDEANCLEVARQVKTIIDRGVEVAVVIGGGNFWRGRTSKTIGRVQADQIGMLATVMNCLYVSEIFRSAGIGTEVFSAFACGDMTTLFSKDAADAALSSGKVAFFGGGIGHPYFSTDTATALRAIELDCDIILMAKNIDGVYSADPKLDPSAKKYDTISFSEVIAKNLKVIDQTASVLCMENRMPLLIFSLNEKDSIINNASGTCSGTIVTID